MKKLLITLVICQFVLISSIHSQDQSIFIFDPNDVSTSFQSTLAQLTDDTVFVSDTLDNAIFNYDAAFLFFDSPKVLSESVVNTLINYTSAGSPLYLFNGPFHDSTTALFWNHIGVEAFYGLLISVLVDSVTGIESTFTQDVVIDTSFMSGYIPVIYGNVDSILVGIGEGPDVNTTYKSGYDSLNVIIDLYNLIDDYGFLERVLQKFGLIPLPQNVQINFFPPVDTALVQGGCCTPEITVRNLSSNSVRASISIEPGPITTFYYFDSTGTQINIDNYYFLVIDSLDEFEYEVWYQPKPFDYFDPIVIPFDSSFYTDNNNFDIQLVVKKDGEIIDSLSQPFHADFGLDVEDEGQLVNHFNLYQNFPNPFNPSTKIKYEIPDQVRNDNALVTLKVYDVLGNEVATLVNEEKQPGTYEVEFSVTSHSGEARNLTSGIYFYQLKTGSIIITKKMVVIK